MGREKGNGGTERREWEEKKRKWEQRVGTESGKREGESGDIKERVGSEKGRVGTERREWEERRGE